MAVDRSHYRREKFKRVLNIQTRDQFEAAFWARVRKSDGCWIWLGNLGTNGYGVFHCNHVRMAVHRSAYEITYGDIPDGLVIDHLCRNRACVRPDHLEPVTGVENTMRGESPYAKRARRTHCSEGHDYTLKTYFSRQRNRMVSTRSCDICAREKAQAKYPQGGRGAILQVYKKRARKIRLWLDEFFRKHPAEVVA